MVALALAAAATIRIIPSRATSSVLWVERTVLVCGGFFPRAVLHFVALQRGVLLATPKAAQHKLRCEFPECRHRHRRSAPLVPVVPSDHRVVKHPSFMRAAYTGRISVSRAG